MLKVLVQALVAGLLSLNIAGCNTSAVRPGFKQLIVVPVDQSSGYLPTRTHFGASEVRVRKADVLVREKSVQPPAGSLLVVDGGSYFIEQLRALELFAEVVSLPQFRQRNQQALLKGDDGYQWMERIYRDQQPFFFMTVQMVFDSALNSRTQQMELVDPGGNFNTLFAARTMTPLSGLGRDELVRRPLFNSLIDWAVMSGHIMDAADNPAEAVNGQ